MTIMPTAAPVMQILLRGSEVHPELTLESNRDGLPPVSFENETSWAPILGSSAVLDLARALVQHGAVLARFDIRDSSLNEISEEDQERLSAGLVSAVRKSRAAAAAYVESELPGLLITGVEIVLKNRRSKVARRGVVHTRNGNMLKSILGSIWQDAAIG
jgi:hypothetical protein